MRNANKRSMTLRSASNKATLNNENRTSMKDNSQETHSATQETNSDTQETNNDSWETNRDPVGTKYEGDSDEPVDTDENSSCRYVVEFKAIDWDQTERSDSSQELTINLASWWLHMMASKNSSMENSYPALGQQIWEIDSETAKSTAGNLPTRLRKRKRSPPGPVPATESIDAGGDNQEPEGSKTGKKRVKFG